MSRETSASLLLALALIGCGAHGPKKPDAGHFEGNVYVQDSFGLRIAFPEGWTILPADESRRHEESGRRVLAGGDPAGGAYRAIGASTSQTLFTVLRYPRGSVPGLNPSIVGGLENVVSRPQLRTAADYLAGLRSFLARGGTPVSMEPIVPETMLGGKPFAVMPVTLRPGDVPVGQVYYCRRLGDFMLTIVATFNSPQQWAEIEPVLKDLSIEE